MLHRLITIAAVAATLAVPGSALARHGPLSSAYNTNSASADGKAFNLLRDAKYLPAPATAASKNADTLASPAATCATMIRGEALNRRYHLGTFTRQSRATQPSSAAIRAMRIRGEALNRKYHLGAYAATRPVNQLRDGKYTPRPTTTAPNAVQIVRIVKPGGFHFRDAGIGAAIGALALAVLGGIAILLLRDHSTSRAAGITTGQATTEARL